MKRIVSLYLDDEVIQKIEEKIKKNFLASNGKKESFSSYINDLLKKIKI